LFYQQWRLARDMHPVDAYGPGIAGHLLSFLFPYPLHRDSMPYGCGSMYLDYGGHFLYYGTLMAVMFLLATVEWLASLLRILRRPKSTHVFTFCALVALWLSLGPEGQLWKLTNYLPYGLRNHPFRVTPFFVMFSVLSGGLMLERLLRRWRGPRAGEIAIGAMGCLLLLYHASCARTAFYSYGFRPYPELSEEFSAVLRSPNANTPYRYVFCGPERSVDPTYPYCLPQSLATLYQYPAFYGYDPLVEAKPAYNHAWEMFWQDVPAACRAYGLRWFLLHRSIIEGHPLSPSRSQQLERTCRFLEALKRVPIARQHSMKSLDEAVLVLEVAGVDPLCFCQDESSRPLPMRMSGRGIDVELGGLSQQRNVVINFLHYPDMRAYVDGAAAPLTTDNWLRMVVSAPAGARLLSVLYQPPWWNGLALGFAVAILASVTVLALDHWARPTAGPGDRPARPRPPRVWLPAGRRGRSGG
jgi:hypothetical protein